MHMPIVLDLFSGVGGMAEGFLQAGFTLPYASDISKQAALTYQHRHHQLGQPVNFYCGDISELARPKNLKAFLGHDLKNIDVVCGGPPCQGFSIAGRRNPSDHRNLLVKSYIQILKQVKPKYFVMENVQGILSAVFTEYVGLKNTYHNQNVINVLTAEFDAIGYHVEIKTLDASDFGVPQQRMRVIFLGTRKDQKQLLLHPEPTTRDNKVTAKEAISDLENILLNSIQDKYSEKAQSVYQQQSRNGRTPTISGVTLQSQQLYNHQTSKHSDKIIERFSLLKEGENLKELFARLTDEQSERLVTKKHTCRRMLSNQPSYTVLTLPDDLVHYSKNRILTVREMARLQSFDDSFEILGKRTTGGDRRTKETPQYTLIGNAVPPLLAKAVADQIMKIL